MKLNIVIYTMAFNLHTYAISLLEAHKYDCALKAKAGQG